MKGDKKVIGVIIDISGSMEKKWIGTNFPKIHVVRNALNNFFENNFHVRENQVSKKVEIFLIGVGLRLTQVFSKVSISNGEEKVVKESETIYRSDIICDLLALSKMIPSNYTLEYLKDKLNELWKSYSVEIFRNANQEKDIDIKLKKYIENSLHDTSKFNWRYQFHVKITQKRNTRLEKIISFLIKLIPLPLEDWNKIVSELSMKEAKRYHREVELFTKDIFKKNKSKYEDEIKNRMETFVSHETRFMLERLALGVESKKIITYFDKDKAFSLARGIYEFLEDDFRKNISFIWQLNKISLLKNGKYIGAKLDMTEIKNLTELYIKEEGWKTLKPFVEKVIFDLFIKKFEENINLLIPYWIDIASKREVLVALKELKKFLPDEASNEFYSTKYMFGSTPMNRAMDLATIRLMDSKHQKKQKILFIISDGEFEDIKTKYSADLLKLENVIIVCCLISNESTYNKIYSKINPKWSFGTKNMFEISSKIEDFSNLKELILSGEIEVPNNAKLCFKINKGEHLSSILNKLVESN